MAVLCKVTEKLYVGFSCYFELHFMHSQTTNEIFFSAASSTANWERRFKLPFRDKPESKLKSRLVKCKPVFRQGLWLACSTY